MTDRADYWLLIAAVWAAPHVPWWLAIVPCLTAAGLFLAWRMASHQATQK